MQKLRSLHDAIAAEIHDGMSIFMGAALESLIPFAAGHEIIRQQKRDLTWSSTN
jgi:glutaconate CoA-transferase subunit A